MTLQCGIVGLPNVGKSTLFNALTQGGATAANFPFCTIDPNVGMVSVPDKRLQLLASMVKPLNTIPTYIELVDIAGLIKGASQGEGLGNQFLANIREVDAILHVIRCFKDDNITHVSGGIDPLFDKEIIDHELRQKDLETLKKRLAKGEKLLKTPHALSEKEYRLLQFFLKELSEGKDARNLVIDATELQIVTSWQLLTSKPVIYVSNVDEATLKEGTNPAVEQLRQGVKKENGTILLTCAAIEEQFNDLKTEEEKAFFLEAYHLKVVGLDQLIQAAYSLLNLITYFTVGPKEVHAWRIKKGTKAPQAGGVIHSDFERGFIKASVIKFADYQQYKTETACKAAGKVVTEGKNYVVEDGDIICFRFNT